MISLAASLIPKLLLWLCLALAWALWRAGHRGGRSSGLTGIALLVFLWLVSTRPIAEAVLTPLERQYTQPPVEDLARHGARQVVVLTAGGYDHKTDLLSDSLPSGSLYRLLAGLEVCEQIGSDCLVLFSGSAGRNNRDIATADSMKRLALRLAPRFEYRAESVSGSTAEHPVNVEPLLRDGPFVLVTSGFHLPRAMRSFERFGLEPIPYPAGRLVRGDYSWRDWLPTGTSLDLTSLAVREYLALLLYSLRGW